MERNGLIVADSGVATGVMRGMRGVILGVANDEPIPGGSLKRRETPARNWLSPIRATRWRRPLAQELGAQVLGHCDVTEGSTIDAVFKQAAKLSGAGSISLSTASPFDKDQLTGRYIDPTEDNFTRSLAVSCYSFTAVAQRAERLMTNGGAMLTLTYYGAEKWMPHYNVMGVAEDDELEASVRYLAADLGEKAIRVNAISAGPIKTLAASGIGDFRYILRWNGDHHSDDLRGAVGLDRQTVDRFRAALFVRRCAGRAWHGRDQA